MKVAEAVEVDRRAELGRISPKKLESRDRGKLHSLSSRGARQLMGEEDSYLRKWKAVVFMNLQINRDRVKRAITKFVRQLGRYEPSSSTTEELHGLPLELMIQIVCVLG